MVRSRSVELTVGLFLIVGALALFVLAMKVSGLTRYATSDAFQVLADFDNVGGLKVRARVTIAGVKVGEVVGIHLNKKDFKAEVAMRIDADQNRIPVDSSASILTDGLLGSNYISIAPGFGVEGNEGEYLKEGSRIEDTHQALILEQLIGKYLFNIKK